MKKVAWLCLLLALALLLTGCAKDESKELEKSAVRVGNVVYTYGDLLDVEASTRSYYEQMAQLYAMYGMEAQMPTDAQLREEALNTLLWQAVVLDKADQMKLSTLTGAEQAEVSARTDAAMADYRAQALELLALPEELMTMLEEGTLSAGHARAILGAPSPALQVECAKKVVENQLSVRQTAALVKALSKPPKEEKPPADPMEDIRIYLDALEKDQASSLGRKFKIAHKGDKGKIELEYYGDEDLESLLTALKTMRGGAMNG